MFSSAVTMSGISKPIAVYSTNIILNWKKKQLHCLLSQRDMSEQQQSLVNVLFDHKIPPTTISKVLSELNDDDKGTFLPKTLFNFNEKSRNLIDRGSGPFVPSIFF